MPHLRQPVPYAAPVHFNPAKQLPYMVATELLQLRTCEEQPALPCVRQPAPPARLPSVVPVCGVLAGRIYRCVRLRAAPMKSVTLAAQGDGWHSFTRQVCVILTEVSQAVAGCRFTHREASNIVALQRYGIHRPGHLPCPWGHRLQR